jgi:hypothetical protein
MAEGLISVEVILYGPLARYGPGEDNSVCDIQHVSVPHGTTIQDLLKKLGVPTEERGVTFVNGKLTAMPGVQPDMDNELRSRDRVAFFHLKSMWPFQYRHGAAVDPALSAALDDLSHSPGSRSG